MKKLPKLIIICGPSGVGKTTLLKSLKYSIVADKEISHPVKITTREHRPSDDPDEIKCISDEAFQEEVEGNGFLVEYGDHGKRYALPNIDESEDGIHLQIVPGRLIPEIKDKLRGKADIYSMRLSAEPDTIFERLVEREGDASKEKLESRRKTAFNKAPDYIDCHIDANNDPETVLKDALRFLHQTLDSTLPTNLFEITDKLSELQYQFCVFGGAAALLYGADRELTDFDLLVDTDDLTPIINAFPQGELTPKGKSYLLGRVEVCRPPTRIGDPEKDQFWRFDAQAIEKLRTGYGLPAISPEDMIVMKAALKRGIDRGKYDLEDVVAMIENTPDLDTDYILHRAEACNVSDEIRPTLEQFGLKI